MADAYTLPVPQIVRDRGCGICRYTLDGVEYQFRWSYIERGDRWKLSVLDTDDSAIVEGIACVASFPLFDLLTDSRRPPGELMLFDTQGQGASPGLDDLGVRVLVVYYPGAA
jgi:hypothetical protein